MYTCSDFSYICYMIAIRVVLSQLRVKYYIPMKSHFLSVRSQFSKLDSAAATNRTVFTTRNFTSIYYPKQ